jgi:hypothetical protein
MRHRTLSTVVRTVEFGLGALFLYLGTVKIVQAHLIMGAAEIIVGFLIVLRASAMVSMPAVIVVAAAEVVLFQRPPVAALACISAHGLTTWARTTILRAHETTLHDR